MNWLRAAGWWASDYAYAVDRQVRSTLSRRKPLLDGGERDKVKKLKVRAKFKAIRVMVPVED